MGHRHPYHSWSHAWIVQVFEIISHIIPYDLMRLHFISYVIIQTNLLCSHDCQMISLAMTGMLFSSPNWRNATARCAAHYGPERGTGSQLASVRRMQLGVKLRSFQRVALYVGYPKWLGTWMYLVSIGLDHNILDLLIWLVMSQW